MARSITVIPAKQILTAESGTAQSVQKLKMAAYCRVSTDQEEQLLSYENQVNYSDKGQTGSQDRGLGD